MYQPVVLYIGLRYMRGRILDRFDRFVSLFSRIGIILSVMVLVIVLSVMNGLERELGNNILKFIPQALLTHSSGQIDLRCVPRSVLKKLSGIKQASPLITGDVILQSVHNVAMGVILGVHSTDPEPLWYYLLDSKKDDLLSGQYRMILGHELATQLGVTRGDQVRVIVPSVSQLTPIGRMPSQRLFIVAGTFSAHNEVDTYQILINQHDAARLMCYPIGVVTGWRLWLNKPLEVAKLSMQFLPDKLVWKDWRVRKGTLFKAVQMEKNMMSLLLSLIVAVAVFNIFSSLGLQVIDKQAAVAILKTQGMTKSQVMQIFIIQGTITGMIGTFIGTCLGILLTTQINWLMPAISILINGGAVLLPVEIKPEQVIVIALSSIIAALLSTLYPSWYAANTHPAKALRYA